MSIPDWFVFSDEVRESLAASIPVVALESTLISHGLPWPTNLETANSAELAVRQAGAIPATIAVWKGQPTIGLSPEQLSGLARATDTAKASRRDLAAMVAAGRTAATTVAGTMHLAHLAGIQVFATGGIGGAHRECQHSFDISADLVELSRTPVLVVCAGAKSILDLPKTLELLETLGVPVVGYRTDRFPAFYVRDSGLASPIRADDPSFVARLFSTHLRLGGAGVLLAQPIDAEHAIAAADVERAIQQAEREAQDGNIHGGAVTPYLLKRLAELTAGRTLQANRELIVANASLGGEVAVAINALSPA